jgi:hypothetical protein
MNRHSEADDDIARRAYRRYEERGRTDGDDQADWFAAEREREQELRQTTPVEAEEPVTIRPLPVAETGPRRRVAVRRPGTARGVPPARPGS